MTWATEAELKRALETLAERYPGQKIEIVSTFDIANVGWECDSQGALIVHDGVAELVIVDQVGGDYRKVREILEAKVEEYERLISETKNVLGQHMVLEGLPQRAIDLEEVDFDLGRDSAYLVAQERMRNRIATLSAEIERLESEIVEVGVEMSSLDYRDRDAIEAAIEKYRVRDVLSRDEAIVELLATARRLAPAFEDFADPSKSDLDVLEAATAMARAMKNWGAFVDDPSHPALEGLEEAHPHTPELDRRHVENMRRRGIESHLDDEVFRGTGDLVRDLGLPEVTRTLWALVRALNACLEDLGMTPAEFAQDAGFPEQEVQRLCDGVVHPEMLARLIEIYDAAAWKSGWSMVREMIDDEIEAHEKTDPGDAS